MVKIHLKHGDVSQFLYETSGDIDTSALLDEIVLIFNGRLQIERICSEIIELAKHGIFLPPNMVGLVEDQIKELSLTDEWGQKCSISQGYVENKDPSGRRNGKAPSEKFASILHRTVDEARAKISKDLIAADVCLTPVVIGDTIKMLKGAVTLAYPMGLPRYDPIEMEFQNDRDSSNSNTDDQIIPKEQAQLWWAGKKLDRQKRLCDFVGKNEKTKIVVKLQKAGQGAPAREPVLSDEQQKAILLQNYRRQEELKKLQDADDDSYLSSEWADNKQLQKSFQGLKNINWKLS